jgi:hypothetical protein
MNFEQASQVIAPVRKPSVPFQEVELFSASFTSQKLSVDQFETGLALISGTGNP